jgi:hypothetical protein
MDAVQIPNHVPDACIWFLNAIQILKQLSKV